MCRRAVLFGAAAAALAWAAGPAASSARAEPLPALEWLQREPVSLLDWGIMRLQRDLSQATGYLAQTYLRAPVPRNGVYFRFFDSRIVAYVTLVDVPPNRTGDVCRDLFGRLRDRLTAGAPQGAGGASWYLESLFSHDTRRGDRPETLGAQLVERVLLQVTIGPASEEAAYGDARRVTCFGRLDAKPEDIALRSEG